MARTFRARFSKGKLEPMEDLGLREGEEIEIAIQERAYGLGMIEALDATSGSWKDLVNCDQLKRDVYDDRLIDTRQEPRF